MLTLSYFTCPLAGCVLSEKQEQEQDCCLAVITFNQLQTVCVCVCVFFTHIAVTGCHTPLYFQHLLFTLTTSISHCCNVASCFLGRFPCGVIQIVFIWIVSGFTVNATSSPIPPPHAVIRPCSIEEYTFNMTTTWKCWTKFTETFSLHSECYLLYFQLPYFHFRYCTFGWMEKSSVAGQW